MHTDFFDIVDGVLQGDTWTPYLFIICQDYVPQKRQEEEDTLRKLFQMQTI